MTEIRMIKTTAAGSIRILEFGIWNLEFHPAVMGKLQIPRRGLLGMTTEESCRVGKMSPPSPSSNRTYDFPASGLPIGLHHKTHAERQLMTSLQTDQPPLLSCDNRGKHAMEPGGGCPDGHTTNGAGIRGRPVRSGAARRFWAGRGGCPDGHATNGAGIRERPVRSGAVRRF